jgi:hypothetical protein
MKTEEIRKNYEKAMNIYNNSSAYSKADIIKFYDELRFGIDPMVLSDLYNRGRKTDWRMAKELYSFNTYLRDMYVDNSSIMYRDVDSVFGRRSEANLVIANIEDIL